MTYSDADFARMETDPDLRRQYFWQVGQKAILRSIRNRRKDLAKAQLDARLGVFILNHLDLMVAATGKENGPPLDDPLTIFLEKSGDAPLS